LFQPFAFACGAAVATTASGDDCTLIVTLALAEFPALSVAVPLKDSFSPTVVIGIDEGQVATPDRASEHVNVIVAGAVTTPCAFATGLTLAVIVGGVLSMLTVVLLLADCPAASVTLALMTWFAPSTLTVCEPGHCSGGTPPLHV
jgi:hypothetical protein